MCGCVEDGIIPGFFGYEAGQSCVGDHFELVRRERRAGGLPRRGPRAAASTSTPCSRRRPARQRVGESGLLALDWWNGNRSVLVDAELGGLLIGATLATTPEEIYRALIEATAFGTRVIIETFEAHGVPVNEIVACGGLAEKSPLIMQIYADVTGRPFRLSASDQTPGARLGDVRGGRGRRGGRRPRHDRGRRRGRWPGCKDRVYEPIPANARGLRRALPRVRPAPRLLRARRERRHEGAPGSARPGRRPATAVAAGA